MREETQSFQIRSGQLKYKFETAWTPCTPVILAMAKAFPGLRFELSYSEEFGAEFAGEFICEDGNILKDEEWKCSVWD